VRIIATSDAHLPVYEAELIKAVERSCADKTFDLLVLAGDMIEKGKISFYSRVREIMSRCSSAAAVATFGNEEYDELREKIVEENPWATWLNDSAVILRLEGGDVSIFGTTGILDVPTRWQRKNIPDIQKKYDDRLKKFEEFLKANFKGKKIALFHYPPTFKTLQGEPTYAWAEMGSLRAEELIKRLGGVDIVIHGHAHNGKVLRANIGRAEVYNAALPARKDLLIIETEKVSRTILDFLPSSNSSSSTSRRESLI